MSLFSSLFGPANHAAGQSVCSNIHCDDIAIMIEEPNDPDGRMYHLEYQSTCDERHVIAWS